MATVRAGHFPSNYISSHHLTLHHVSQGEKVQSCDHVLTFQVGRVKIQVYRGPSKGEGYDVFAPWGYYNTQPADLAIHH